jgi:hypothetical protein
MTMTEGATALGYLRLVLANTVKQILGRQSAARKLVGNSLLPDRLQTLTIGRS